MQGPAATRPKKDLSTLYKLKFDDWRVNVFRTIPYGGGTGEEYPDNLKNDGQSAGNKWLDNEKGETWAEGIFNPPIRIQHLQLKSANDCPDRDPYEITISYKNKDGKEKTIGHYDNIEWNDRYEVKDFEIDTGEEVKSLRITFNRNRNFAECGNWGSGIQISQIILYR